MGNGVLWGFRVKVLLKSGTKAQDKVPLWHREKAASVHYDLNCISAMGQDIDINGSLRSK
jgi:hypothetical protein